MGVAHVISPMHELCGAPSTLSPPFPSTSSSSHSSFISCTSSCTSSTILRAVASLCTPPKRVWTLLTTPTSSQEAHSRELRHFVVCELPGKSNHQVDKACDQRLDRFISHFHCTRGQVFSRTSTLRVTWQTPKQRQEACCAFWEAAQSRQVAGLARRRQLFHIAVPKQ